MTITCIGLWVVFKGFVLILLAFRERFSSFQTGVECEVTVMVLYPESGICGLINVITLTFNYNGFDEILLGNH